MKTVKNRRITFGVGELSHAMVLQKLIDELDFKAALLWLGYNFDAMIESPYFRSISLGDNTDGYYCQLIVRKNVNNIVVINYEEVKK